MTRPFCGLSLLVAAASLAGCGRPTNGSAAAAEQDISTADYVPLPKQSGPAEVAVSDRARVREFWDVYHQATEAKQALRWEAAAAGYRKALEIDPNHWDSLYYLGNCLSELGQFKEALKAYQRLAKNDPQAGRSYSALGALYSNPAAGTLFDLAAAERAYHQAWRSNADESGPVLRLGEVTLAAGKWDKAREYLDAAARTNFKSVHARYLQGYLAWRAGDKAKAEELFRAAVDLTKGEKPPKGVLGEGDTKLPGHRAMVRPGTRGLFDGLAAELWVDSDTSSRRVGAVYQQVDRFVSALKQPARVPR